MAQRLPSLTALRFFAAAGKLQSFSNAAGELHVTQGAVSRQIRALEDQLGVKLFDRLTRQVVLTEEGRKYLKEVQLAFSQLERATQAIKEERTHAILHISALPSIGSYWLMPRLAKFAQDYPEIETRINNSIEPAPLHSRGTDIAIRVGIPPGEAYDSQLPAIDLTMTSNWEDVLAEKLAPDILVPVYSRHILHASAPLSDPEIFAHLPIIHTTSRSDAWRGWMSTFGLNDYPVGPRIEYGHFFMSLDAARQGMGVALIPEILLANIDTQNLIIANEYSVRSSGNYYVLCLRSRSAEPSIRAFRNWIKGRMQEQSV